MKPTLYGIKNSNRESKDFWGKNTFNSSFPVALAAYMRDKNIKVNYLKIDADLNVVCEEVSVDYIFNTADVSSDDIYYSFESKYDPYQEYAYDDIGSIDLVIKDKSLNPLRALEVKMTVIPDNSTYKKDESEWGAEIVFRPATTSYCALGIADSFKNEMQILRSMFEPVGSEIESWTNTKEILLSKDKILHLLNRLEKLFYDKQKPFIMQPVWKTKKKSPILEDNAFDIFVWSDFAFTRLFIDSAMKDKPSKKQPISRQLRSSVRLARSLYEISRSKKVKLDDVYKKMSFGNQTDKSFSVPGRITNHYMACNRLKSPILKKNVIDNIILNGGGEMLSPERRLDQTLYFTMFNK